MNYRESYHLPKEVFDSIGPTEANSLFDWRRVDALYTEAIREVEQRHDIRSEAGMRAVLAKLIRAKRSALRAETLAKT